MRTTPGPKNPYGYNRYGYAWAHVPTDGAAHLDFGCGDGRFLTQLTGKHIGTLVGVDIDRDAVKRAQAQSHGRYEVVHIDRVTPLPFPDKTFSSVTLLDVLEHVDDQRGLLNELHRILEDNGLLIITVPGRHLFSVLDMGNMKFRFPNLHRWYYCRNHDRSEYEQRYSTNPDGLIGDVSAAKRWHEHFSHNTLNRLLTECGYVVTEFDGTGYFARLLKIVAWLTTKVPSCRRAIERVMTADAHRFKSSNLFCIATKMRNPDVKCI